MYNKIFLKRTITLEIGKNGYFYSKNIKSPKTIHGIFCIYFVKKISNFCNVKNNYFSQNGSNNKKKLKAISSKNTFIFLPLKTYIKLNNSWYYINNKIFFYIIKKKIIKIKKIYKRKKIILSNNNFKIKNIYHKKIYSFYKKNFTNFLKNFKIIIIIINSIKELTTLNKIIKIKKKIYIFFNKIKINKYKKYCFYIKTVIKYDKIIYFLKKLNIL